MAQNQFINITVDANAVNRTDIGSVRHSGGQAASAASDFTISWDSAKVPNLNILRSAVAQALTIAAGQLK